MRRDMATLHRNIKVVEETHGENVLNLILAVDCVRKLPGNTRIGRHIRNHHEEILREFEKILGTPELEGAVGA